MSPLAAESKALLFSAGGVRLALRLSQVREIVAAPQGEGEVTAWGEVLPTAFVSTVLGLPAGTSPYALLVEGPPPAALRIGALHGIVDLGDAECFQLPARTLLPQPPPFAGAVVVKGEIALELSVATLGFAPLEPALEPAAGGLAPAEAAAGERELRFACGGRAFAVPLSLMVQVLEDPRIVAVPLTPPSHRGLLYHGRALHPVLDAGVLYGDPPRESARRVILLDAGGASAGVIADRVLGVGEQEGDVFRPAWDALLAP